MNNASHHQSRFRKTVCAAVWTLFFISACGIALNTEARLARGQQAYDSGDYRAAIIDAKNILQTEPDHIGARLLLGRSSIGVGDIRSAEKELRRALELGAENRDVVVDLGRTLLMLREFDKIAEEITIDLAEDEDMRLDIRRIHADALFAQGHAEEARAIYREILAVRTDDLDTMLVVVSTYVASDEHMQARATLDEIITLAPQYVPAWLASGSLHALFRNFDRAEQDFRKAAEFAAQDDDLANQVKAMTGVGESQLARGDLEALKATVASLEAIAPGTMPVQYLAARTSYLAEDWDAASAELQNILRQDPNFVPAKVLLGAVQLYRGNLGQAEVHLSNVVAVMPSHLAARKLLAEVQLRQNRAEDAADMLRPMVSGDTADPGALAMAARASIGTGDFDEAIRYLAMRSGSDPDDPKMKMDLAAAHLSVGDIEEAQAILQTLPELSGDNSYRREFLLILSAVRNGDYEDALSAALQMQETWPDDARVHNLVGGIRVTIGDADGAKQSFNSARAADPADIVSLINLARFDVADQEFDAATELYKQALELQPDNVGVLVSLGQVAVYKGDSENAIHWLSKAGETDPSNIASRVILGRVYVANQEFVEAERVVREAIALNDEIADLHNTLGLAMSGKGDHESASKSLEKAIELAPDVPVYPVNLAREYLFRDEDDRAEELLRNSLTTHPDHIPTSALLSYVYMRSGDTGKAITEARDLEQRNPNSAGPKILLGELLYAAEQNEEASRLFDEAVEISNNRDIVLRAYQLKSNAGLKEPEAPLRRYLATEPADTGLRIALAQDYQSKNNVDAAVVEYEKVLETDPNNFVALNNLAWMHFTLGNPEAEELARRAQKVAPDNSAVADTLGWILVKKGSAREGVQYLRKAVDLDKEAAEIRYHLAVGLAETGATDEARGLLTEILAAEENFSGRDDAEALLGQL